MPASPRLVVKHAVLSSAEANKIAKRFKTTLDKFPKIAESDPQAKKIGAKPGQLVEIKRDDPTGSYLYYRFVKAV
ncbi:MAG TPA: DNA-directed RNA polymerase subunit RpoH/Rpb5 C-terminal domain-containing protein [Candidatus Acidoferrum sp.]|nr:DNA-directed RNA polymerase subunit RpoH/Rpb5 C-terminal domain-containing protein [Candidatus Acidoferrum sp.]